MSYRQRNGTLVLTDVSVVAARGSANRQRLMTKMGVLAKAREVKKRKENEAHAKANKAKFIPLVFEARGGFGEDAISFFKSAARANSTAPSSVRSNPGNTALPVLHEGSQCCTGPGLSSKPCAGIP